jgi:hypothetical protein
MAKKYPGLYLYYDWLEGIEQMGQEEGYRMVLNLYHYAKEGTAPTPLSGANNIVQNMCIAQIERAKKQGEGGRLGMERRYGKKPASRAELPEILRDCPLYIDPDDDPEELAMLQRALNRGSSRGTA